jgi:photosystem II stability/assembly factor-like uncharacterized protein
VRSSRRLMVSLVGCAFLLAPMLTAQPVDPQLLTHLHWRMIGPFRGGRTVAAVGVPGQTDLFYMGVNNGGVWRTDDSGRTWKPLFDSQPTQSIGSIAIAPSNPKILYVGSGEGLQRPDLSVGDGIYKSTDGGDSWTHLGLRDGQQIPALLVDPHDPNRVFAAVLGHPYGPSVERGVFRSTDGGSTWQKVLYRDENTGAVGLAFDPRDSKIVYADMWAARQAPWEIGGSFQAAGSGLYKSTDGGNTWKPLSGGLPTWEQGLGRIGFAVSPSNPKRLYAQVDADPQHGGTYRSDDAGETWRQVNHEDRIWGRGGDFAEVEVDPKDPDTIYICNTSTYRSRDGGQTFTAIKGAPGGDDYHRIWINPDDPKILLLTADQGAAVSRNGGRTWSSWYNQPTAQFYHVITDHRFPYWVYGGQQESGSAAVASRGNDGEITFREFHPVSVEEYGYVAPDPLNPNLIYGGKLTRFDWSTGQVQEVAPEAIRSGKFRYVRTLPVLFSPTDPHTLYFGANVLFKTRDGGDTWSEVSPDLTRETPGVPDVVGIFEGNDPQHGKHRGVIYTVAPSPAQDGVIWAGTDDGLIHVTKDGGAHWKDVTPPALTPWSKVSLLEASHFDAGTAYAAINRFRLDDLRPHIYRTKDFGATWQEVINGINERAVVNAVREDPVRRGLLFAATELGVFVSFNDGALWQPLQLNLPASAVRDLVIHDDDLVVGTHGRSFWILDDMSSLRQFDDAAFKEPVHLFRPASAVRVHRDLNSDTPLPPEEPAGANPPDGAIFDFHLGAVEGPIVLEIHDAKGHLVRRFSSADVPAVIDPKDIEVPMYWVRAPTTLPAGPGIHRFVWDLHYAPPPSLEHGFPIAAILEDTPREPSGPWVLPGQYEVRLTAGGHTVTAPLTVTMDPRVKTSRADLEAQSSTALNLYEALRTDAAEITWTRALRQALAELPAATRSGALAAVVTDADKEAASLLGAGGGRGAGRTASEYSLASLNGALALILGMVDGPDLAPTEVARISTKALLRSLDGLEARVKALRETTVPALNLQLKSAGLTSITLAPPEPPTAEGWHRP